MPARDESGKWDACYRDRSYRDRWDYHEPTQELVSFIASGAAKPGPCIDLGCGAGIEAVYLASHGFRAHGVDWSRTAIAIARRRARRAGVKVDFRVGSVLEMPFPARSFVLATDRGCLHSLWRKDWVAYASEVARVLRPGGILFLRAARPSAGPGFTPLREADLPRYFAKSFRTLAFEKITLVADSGDLLAHLAVLRRK